MYCAIPHFQLRGVSYRYIRAHAGTSVYSSAVIVTGSLKSAPSSARSKPLLGSIFFQAGALLACSRGRSYERGSNGRPLFRSGRTTRAPFVIDASALMQVVDWAPHAPLRSAFGPHCMRRVATGLALPAWPVVPWPDFDPAGLCGKGQRSPALEVVRGVTFDRLSTGVLNGV
ncbi:hypothetical protein MRX96_016240 [Rhipicephalus microplus]